MNIKSKRRRLIEEDPYCYFCARKVTYEDSGLFNLNNKNPAYKQNGIHIGTIKVLACLDCIYKKRYPDINSNSRNHKRRLKLLEKDPHCHFCKKELDIYTSTLDHLLPKSKGGKNTVDNLVLSCYICNHKKGNGSASKFMKSINNEGF
jgi:5-methylcytosine-specific restriction endonuclease McrA